eukprot:TRINITY_DN864_c0_g1_i1.p1 TRINITY_DN864_c0_g1~~TRINITY_DN864_c0_g1_i1.p1  ORF type:complete len:365 (+),score=74.91 TRINITY_DN864_c0_g1_i1:219-1313(+)
MGCYPSKGIVSVPSSRTVSTIDVRQYPQTNGEVAEGKGNDEKEGELAAKSGEGSSAVSPPGLMPQDEAAGVGIANSENEKKPIAKTNIPAIRLPPSLFEGSPLNSTIKRPLSSPISERPIPTQQLFNPDNSQDVQYANVIQSIVRGYILRKHHKLRLQQLEFSFLKSVNPDNIKPTSSAYEMYNISLPGMDLAEDYPYLIPSAPMGSWNLLPNNNNNFPVLQHGTSSLAGGSVISTVSSPSINTNNNSNANTPSKSPLSSSLFSPGPSSSPLEPSMESLLADDKDKVKYGSYKGVPLYHRKSSMTALPPSPTLHRKGSIPSIRDDSVIASKPKELMQSEEAYTPRSRGRTMGSVVDPSLLPKLK